MLDKTLSWIKLHKKATAIIIAVLLVIGLTGGGNSNKPTSNSSAPKSSARSATKSSTARPLNISIRAEKVTDNATGTYSIDYVNPQDVNEANMRTLCGNLHQAAIDGKKYYHTDVYDDQKAIADRDIVIKDQATDAQNSNYDAHYVLIYNYNPGRDDHCAITLNGIDSNQIDVNY